MSKYSFTKKTHIINHQFLETWIIKKTKQTKIEHKFSLHKFGLKNSTLDNSTFHTYQKEEGGKYQFETKGVEQQDQARGARSNKITSVTKRYLSKKVT
jgi:hypothetical protein